MRLWKYIQVKHLRIKVDLADLKLLKGKKLYTYSRCYVGFRYRDPNTGYTILGPLHYLIVGGVLPHEMVDHVNRDTLDNRRSNLRKCSRAQNAVNSKLRVTNSSGYRGVSFSKGRWAARIRDNYAYVHLGLFDDPVAAARAYDSAALKLHKEFASLNFPA